MASPIFSDPGVALATFLHTFGAIGYMGGIAFYVGWVRSARRGHDNPTVLATGASLTYVSILLNLLGGFVRTYLPGHPKLTEFGSSTWVTLMALKHVALFAGIAAAVYLFELHAPRIRRSVRDGTPVAPARERNAQAMLSTVVASIIVAAVLGGASTVLDLDGPAAPGPGLVLPERPPPQRTYSNGSVSQGAPDSGTFDVPPRTSRIQATFAAEAPQGLPVSPYRFTLELRDPTGAAFVESTPDGPTDARRIELEVPAPSHGTWDYVVTTEVGLAAAYTLEIVVVPSIVFEAMVSLAAGEAFEINTHAQPGAVLGWDWQATAHLAWNIHTHAGGFQAVVEDHAQSATGRFVVEQEGGHSFFWQAESATTLTFEVWGDFEIESVVGP